MIDVQNQEDHRNINIDKVGVKNIRYPLTVMDRENDFQHTVATINMYVNLPRKFKGTHMSRFIEILNEFYGHLDIREFSKILGAMQKRLEAQSAHLEIAFPYFIEKKSPVTETTGLMEYGCRVIGSMDHRKGYDLIVEVNVPITTVCPCSREISNYGAHNQRGMARLAVRYKKFVWIEDLIRVVEEAASCEVYSLLKRPDEKYVTERGYENPKFVEDVVRDIAAQLKPDPNILWFQVDVENFESIHNHSAYAFIERSKANP
ncbi:GTP cyclohydrolase FolE2 [Desulfoglaeba alkanexedens]|jgi:GTP cyclohydrolase I|uniref:GTP cyclohydrolase FolE2 n=1 Tax=Desulfoglaeba alkanexedens ALDC TaxID=980445 RepID=A0A4P8L124_9BACT|nr:GTP cyclohydrolase FolE2 [Desulfoglaeba alkanexedens]QCQ21556.1 GTP cyclohydrolase I FolE2 [Desulfoglaeba alkanexedens ALDC]